MLWSRQRSRATVAAGVIVIVIVGAIALLGTADQFSEGSERLSDQNLITRLEIYDSLLQLAILRPWFGAHPGGYLIGLREAGFHADMTDSAHNMLLNITSQWGIPMAAFFTLAMVGTLWRSLVLLPKLRRALRANPAFDSTDVIMRAVAAAVVTYFVHGLTEPVPPEAIFLLLGITLAAWIRLDKQRAIATTAAGATSVWRPGVIRAQG